MGTVPIPQGATIGELEQPKTVPIPEGAHIGDEPDEGFLHKAWRVINSPVADLISGAPGATKRAILGSIEQAAHLPPGSLSPENLQSQMQRVDPNHPAVQGLRTFVAGAMGDTADTAASFTSPLSLGTAALGAAGQAPGAVGKVAKAGGAVVGAGFAAKGAHEVYQAGLDPSPEAMQQRLQGGAMVAGGYAGIGAAGRESVLGKAPMRGSLAEKSQTVPQGERFSPAQVNDAARENGVNLDAAQATGSGLLHQVKKGNRYSITAQGTYNAAGDANQAALESWATKEAERYSPDPVNREAVGATSQAALVQDLAGKKTAAAQMFRDIDQRNGGAPVDATNTVEAEARKIVSESSDYYDKHPELKPKQAWSIIQDLAERPTVQKANAQATAPGLVDVNGQPFQATGSIQSVPAAKNVMSWGELHRLRSDLMDIYRNNPDAIKGQSEAWLQRMVGKIDEAMTQSAGALTGPDLEKFRQANQIWQGIKSTYDNPQSPVYHALRTPYPSSIPQMLGKNKPEVVQQVLGLLGNAKGPFQRQFVESLVRGKDGTTLDLDNLNRRLNNVPDDVMTAMLGADGAQRLRMLGKVSQVVTADQNPSGTAKVGVPAAEISGMFHSPIATAAELAGQYGIAKGMNSQKVIDYLTVDPKELAKLPPAEAQRILRMRARARQLAAGATSRNAQNDQP